MVPVKRKRCFYSSWFLLLTIIILSAACAGWRHDSATIEYVGQMLPASTGRGATLLEIEINYNRGIRSFVQNYGIPDYIYIVSNFKTQLIYIEKDLILTFTEGGIIYEPIPSAVLALVSSSDRQRVLSARIENPKPSYAKKPGAITPHGPQTSTEVTPREEKTTNVARSIGTGFAVSPNGLVLTAYHVAEGASSIKVHLFGGDVFQARIERSSPTTDLLLLRLDTKFSAYLTPISTHSLSIGEHVFTIGYPAIDLLGEEPKFTEGSIAALSGPGGDAMFIQISVPVQPGNSGGPLVTERGDLVGVVIGSANVLNFLKKTGTLPQNVSWAIKADYVCALLPPLTTAKISSSREEAINQTKLSVCVIEAIKDR
jgi:S1-C subfamily serine protease